MGDAGIFCLAFVDRSYDEYPRLGLRCLSRKAERERVFLIA